MRTVKYDKLIRDRIPEVMEASGKTCTTDILPQEDSLRMPDAGVIIPAAEFLNPVLYLRSTM